jgi:hypothetical protein
MNHNNMNNIEKSKLLSLASLVFESSNIFFPVDKQYKMDHHKLLARGSNTSSKERMHALWVVPTQKFHPIYLLCT